jgi:hypothetical protein
LTDVILAAWVDGALFTSRCENIRPLLVTGLISPPLGLWLFQRANNSPRRGVHNATASAVEFVVPMAAD